MENGLVLKKLVNFMESRVIQLDSGETLVKLDAKEHMGINVVILYIQEVLNRSLKKPSKIICMLEFLLKNKKTIYKDNVISSGINTQIISLLKTSDLGLITKEKDFLNCWNYLVKEESGKLWSSVKTDSVDLDSIYLNGCSYKTIRTSWFTNKLTNHRKQNLQKIFLPFYKYLLVGGTEKENTELIRTRKYRLKLTNNQKKILKEWNNNYRYMYNKAVYYLKGEDYTGKNNTFSWISDVEEKSSRGNYYGKYDLQKILVPEERQCRIEWIKKVRFNIKAYAVFEAHTNYKTNLDRVLSGEKKFFNLSYKSKKSPSWTFNISKQNTTLYTKGVSLYKDTGIMKLTEKIDKIECDGKIHFDGKHFYYLNPEKREMKKSKADSWFCSLDPGVRKFQTLYSPTGNSLEIANRGATKLYNLLLRLDNSISKKDKKLQAKLRIRIKNLQQELHNKTSRFICENYKNIYIPKLTKENDIIRNTKLKTKTVRGMVVLGHCKFVELLKIKAKEYTNVHVNITTEEYTSQTCLRCKNRTKTSNEIYKCKTCDYTIDRDLLGSCNILLKQWGLMSHGQIQPTYM